MRNLSFGKLACRLIGGAGSGTVGIEEATMHTAIPLDPGMIESKKS